MKKLTFARTVGVVAAAVAIAAPAASGAGLRVAGFETDLGSAHSPGGAVSYVYAPPPLDAGSALPNPDYVVPSRPDDRATRPLIHGKQGSLVAASQSEGFEWGDAGLGAVSTLALILTGIGSILVFRRGRREAVAA